jgi:hypothetical protein
VSRAYELKKRDEKLKLELEPQKKEIEATYDMKETHWQNECWGALLADELEKKGQQLARRLKQQRDELVATFEETGLEEALQKPPLPGTTPEYKNALAVELDKKDEEMKQTLERRTEEMQAGSEKNVNALKQKHEQEMNVYVATTT